MSFKFSGIIYRQLFIFCIVCFCLLIITAPLSAFDFSIRPKGFVLFPSGDGNLAADGNERYSMGGGGEIGLEVDFSTIWPNRFGLGYTFGIDAGMAFNPTLNDQNTNINFYSAGSVLGLYFYPVSRMLTRLDGALGVYQASLDNVNSPAGLYLRGGGELGFRFSPVFTVAANAGWRQYQASGENPLNSGSYVGMTAQISLQSGSVTSEGVTYTLNQPHAMYPALMQSYQLNAIGDIVLHNTENAEIRDVHVFFRAAGYTSSEFLCGQVSVIPRGRSLRLPLLADFSPNIMLFTDSGRIIGEIVVRYKFLGREREVVRAVTVATNNRSKFATDDISSLAAFISPTSPETLEFARFVAGLERTARRTGHNQSLHYAIWLFECLRASGIRLGETYSSEDEAQFPAETLMYRTGSNRDIALLFASALEGVGISSAFVDTGNDFLVAVSMGVNTSGAETLFNGIDKILIVNDRVWLPLSMKAYSQGFSAAWTRGATALRESFSDGGSAFFFITDEAWAEYPPALLPVLGRSTVQTDNAAATREVNRAMQSYIDQEISVVLRRVQSQANATPTAVLFNRLGILMVRAGRIPEAKTAYERAAGMGSVPAMTNRGNLALTERDFAGAERWFRQALARESQNRAALAGLEKATGGR